MVAIMIDMLSDFVFNKYFSILVCTWLTLFYNFFTAVFAFLIMVMLFKNLCFYFIFS